MRLGDDSINWVESIKYLGVHIVGGKKLSFDIQALSAHSMPPLTISVAIQSHYKKLCS